MTGTAVSKTKSPRVSIGMPVYNGARHVAKALESLLAQTFMDFEIVIADNCSDAHNHQRRNHGEKRDRVDPVNRGHPHPGDN